MCSVFGDAQQVRRIFAIDTNRTTSYYTEIRYSVFECYRSPIAQSLALDILIRIASIRLTRLRSSQNNTEIKTFQLETIRSVQARLPSLLRSCLLHAGRSIAHKCIKLIILCNM